MNLIHIAGHLGADPEVRFTSSGQKVTTFRVAARVRRGGADETIWWRVTVWGEQYDKMIAYLKKGSGIMVVGEMNKPEIFTDREGRPQVSVSVTAVHIMFSPFGRTDKQQDVQNTAENISTAAPQEKMEKSSVEDDLSSFTAGKMHQDGIEKSSFDDEIPF